MIKGFIIETTYGLVTSLFVKGYESEKWWHNASYKQGVYLFKTKNEARKVARLMKRKFKHNSSYHTSIITVYDEQLR